MIGGVEKSIPLDTIDPRLIKLPNVPDFTVATLKRVAPSLRASSRNTSRIITVANDYIKEAYIAGVLRERNDLFRAVTKLMTDDPDRADYPTGTTPLMMAHIMQRHPEQVAKQKEDQLRRLGIFKRLNEEIIFDKIVGRLIRYPSSELTPRTISHIAGELSHLAVKARKYTEELHSLAIEPIENASSKHIHATFRVWLGDTHD